MTAEPEKNRGCSYFLQILFRRKKRGALPYRLRDDFLSPAELSFYHILASVLGSRLTLLTKVRLADIFFVARPNENIGYFNRIAQKHVDFLLCRANTLKPVIGIELDDVSHNRASRHERDVFVEQVFQAAGVSLLHIPVQREYNRQEIVNRLSELLNPQAPSPAPDQPNTAAQSASQEVQASAPPLCPKCGIPMVVRTAGEGAYKGEEFYGCRNFPRCREMLSIVA